MYRRKTYETLKGRIGEERRFIQVVAGPRQVGKSTLVRQVVADLDIPYTMESADAVMPTDKSWIGNLWEAVRQQMLFAGQKEHLLVIDEVHKVENWSEQVKREWDEDTRNGLNIKVVLLGSSRLLLKKGLTESLMGRFELIRMTHWSYEEMRDAFGWSVSQYIYFGGYPGCADMIRDERRWQQYLADSIIAPSIDKDVVLTANIYKPALMRRLFELGCAYSGEELSLNKMMGQLQDAGNVTTLSNYLTLLNESALLAGLQKYAKDKVRRYSSVPKLQVYNSALLTATNGRSFEKEFTDPKRWGRWVETAVGAYLVNSADELGYKVYYWREADDEVDFVLERRDALVALEVKSGRRTTNQGLGTFREAYRPRHAVYVGSGGIPVEEFLLMDLRRLWE